MGNDAKLQNLGPEIVMAQSKENLMMQRSDAPQMRTIHSELYCDIDNVSILSLELTQNHQFIAATAHIIERVFEGKGTLIQRVQRGDG